MNIQRLANRLEARASRPFERSATNFVIVINGDSYVAPQAGNFTTVLVEARIYHSEYAARCAIAQHKAYIGDKEWEIVPLEMSLQKKKRKSV